MTLRDKTMILYALRGIDYTYDDIRFEMWGKDNQLIRIDEECNGEMCLVYKEPHSRKECHMFLRQYNPDTHRRSYYKELIDQLIKALGRKRIKEAKEIAMDDYGYTFK